MTISNFRRAVLIPAWFCLLLSANPVSADMPDRWAIIAADLKALATAMANSDAEAKRRLAQSIETELADLHRSVLELETRPLTSNAKELGVVAVFGDLDVSAVVEALADWPGIETELRWLTRNVVTELSYRTASNKEFRVRYYEPGKLYIAVDQAGPAVGDLLSHGDRAEHFAPLERSLSEARGRAVNLPIAVEPRIAHRLGLSEPLVRMRFLDNGVVQTSSEPGRSRDDLLNEVGQQISYILNVKTEGPPVLKALQSGLFFSEELGMGAWGGRWAAFDGLYFVFRYSPEHDDFLVRVDVEPAAP